MTAETEMTFSMDKLIGSGRASLVPMNATKTTKPEDYVISVRDFWLRVKEFQDVFSKGFLPRHLKSELQLPLALDCKDVVANLHSTKYSVIPHTFPFPLRQVITQPLLLYRP